mmetsp:Transcript_9158/g.20655  ORF Transcript_9158/g.20655 Transcript_9158/m.20655 type:complete len:263 (-) Transcript_9158:29-817(-)
MSLPKTSWAHRVSILSPPTSWIRSSLSTSATSTTMCPAGASLPFTRPRTTRMARASLSEGQPSAKTMTARARLHATFFKSEVTMGDPVRMMTLVSLSPPASSPSISATCSSRSSLEADSSARTTTTPPPSLSLARLSCRITSRSLSEAPMMSVCPDSITSDFPARRPSMYSPIWSLQRPMSRAVTSRPPRLTSIDTARSRLDPSVSSSSEDSTPRPWSAAQTTSPKSGLPVMAKRAREPTRSMPSVTAPSARALALPTVLNQ